MADKGKTKELSGRELVSIPEILPPNLLLLPVAQTTLFPGMIVPVILPEGRLTKTIDHVLETNGFVGVVLYRSSSEIASIGHGPSTSVTGLPAEGTVPLMSLEGQKVKEEFYPLGVAAKVIKRINLPDNQVSVLLSGVQRFEIKSMVNREPNYLANVTYLYEEFKKSTELEAMLRTALSQFKQLSKDNPLISEEIKVALVNIDGPGKLADFMSSVLVRDVEDYQAMLKAFDVKDRLQYLLLLLKKEQDVQSVQRKIQDEINQKVASSQREYYLQEQLKLIQKELGRNQDEKGKTLEKFKKRIEGKKLSPDAKKRFEDESERLLSLHEQSAEYSVCLNYLDWLTALPWGVRVESPIELKKAKNILDKDHYGLKEVKERILEFLSVRKVKKHSQGSILCLVGPPGVGKTSLGKSIAKALGRKFFRFSVGGMRDEAEIKGHRKTYVGSMPGKMVQGLKRVESMNPVFLIDEIDKLSSSFHTGGDPSSALLELLDPEQNTEFLDHYLDVPFNCSEVFFITTANTTDTIPPALLDRMEVIHLSGYTENEKYHIAKDYLVPRQFEKNGVTEKQLKFSEKGLRLLISNYARESGVRNLEKQIEKICRKVTYKNALEGKHKVTIDSQKGLHKYLGIPPFDPEQGINTAQIGVATGLAWTNFGGEVLYIESRAYKGKGGFQLTGSLGDVMKESASIAFSIARDFDKKLKLSKNYFEDYGIHLHVPAGATPKDGPSAGVTMVVSLYSLLAKKKVKKGVAMTGEVSLTGRVLPVGGIKEKVLAAKRAGFDTVLLPKLNRKDLEELDKETRKGVKFVEVSELSEAIEYLF